MENVYETTKILGEYLCFHYGRGEEVLPWKHGPKDALGFAQRCVSETLTPAERKRCQSALDIGCAVGGSSFELAKHCQCVVGIDNSKAFIEAAEKLRTQGWVEYYRTLSGAITLRSLAEAPAGVDPERIRFEVGDACKLRKEIGSYDLVLAANLIDRLPKPKRFLQRLPELVNKGGYVVLTSPYTWLEEFTPKKEWIGGTEETGETSRALEAEMKPHFQLVRRIDLPFLIREHARKYQWSVAEASVWRRS